MAKQAKAHKSSAGELVLQWLTYAFWGWFIMSMIWLVGATSMHFLGQKGNESFGPSASYAVAAALVLFTAALVTDFVYSRVEPKEKRGAAQLLMIIHAVIFALAGIAATVVALFALVSILLFDISSYETTDGKVSMLITGLTVAILFLVLLVRVVWPQTFGTRARLYRYGMSGVLILTLVATSVGPITYLYQTKQDRLIEAALPVLSNDIAAYASSHDSLPKTLGDVKTSSDEVSALLERDLVEYRRNTKPASSTMEGGKESTSPGFLGATDKAYYYQLCVTYQDSKNQSGSYYRDLAVSSFSPDVYVHDKGRVCYDLVTSVYVPLAEPSSGETTSD